MSTAPPSSSEQTLNSQKADVLREDGASGPHPWYLYSPIFAIGGIVGFIIGTGFFSSDVGISISLATVALCGAGGGVLYAIRTSQLNVPKITTSNDVCLGWLADCAFGIAGAFVVFMMTPGLSEDVPGFNGGETSRNIDWIEVIAVALVGGYAGRALMEKAQDSVTQVDAKVEKTRSDLEQYNSQLQDRIESLKQQIEHDEAALALAIEQLSPDMSTPSFEDLSEKIGRSSYSTKRRIFFQTRRALLGNITESASRTIPALRALVAADPDNRYHETRSLLSRAHAAQGEWDLARMWISKAIAIRDEQGLSGFERYEELLAECLIKLDPASQSGEPSDESTKIEILGLLEKAHPNGNESLANPTLGNWLEVNCQENFEVGLPR